jgi:hypothetical protein
VKPAVRPLFVMAAVTLLIVVSGCSRGTSTSNASPSRLGSVAGDKLDAAVPMPAGLPTGLPIYPGARLTDVATFTSGGQTSWALVWETLDGVDKVQAFYAAKLAQGDWAISFSGGSNGQYSAVFARKSNTKFSGLLGADSTSVPGVTKITVALAGT